jgi:hypothetical protein
MSDARNLRRAGRKLARAQPKLRGMVVAAFRSSLRDGASEVDACAAAHIRLAEALGYSQAEFSEGFVAEALGVKK